MFSFHIDKDVTLRMGTLDDADEFFNLTYSSKDHLKEWLSWVNQINSVEDSRRNLRKKLTNFAENGGYPESVLIICKGKIAGTIRYNYIDLMNRVGEIGYWLGEPYQGKGIMTKALKAIIDYGFQTLDLNRIEMTVAAEGSGLSETIMLIRSSI